MRNIYATAEPFPHILLSCSDFVSFLWPRSVFNMRNCAIDMHITETIFTNFLSQTFFVRTRTKATCCLTLTSALNPKHTHSFLSIVRQCRMTFLLLFSYLTVIYFPSFLKHKSIKENFLQAFVMCFVFCVFKNERVRKRESVCKFSLENFPFFKPPLTRWGKQKQKVRKSERKKTMNK